MKKLILCAVVAASMAPPFAAPSSAGPVGEPTGRKCAFNSTTDVTREADWQTGQINAGPLYTGADGTLHCKIVVNNGGLHSSPAVVIETTPAMAGVAVMPVRPLNYPATAADDVYLCTSWTPVSGPTLYWVSQSPPNLGYWDTNPNASCGGTLSIEPNDPECSIWHYIDDRAGTNIAEIWQDCEPYPPFDPCKFIFGQNPPNPPCPLPPPLRKPE